MDISNNGVAFLKKEEGFRLKAYQDAVGVWTIGYGNTTYENGLKVKSSDQITEFVAENLLKNKLRDYVKAVNSAIKMKLNQNQFDALVSICYNIGTYAFSNSTLVNMVNNNPNDSAISLAFEAWRFAGGKPILLNRRKREYQLYNSSILGVISKF